MIIEGSKIVLVWHHFYTICWILNVYKGLLSMINSFNKAKMSQFCSLGQLVSQCGAPVDLQRFLLWRQIV